MANYKVSMNKGTETKCTQTNPKFDREKQFKLKTHQHVV
jgi:hypothetical protein